MEETTFIVDSYTKNIVYEGDRGVVHQIYHLFNMVPGTDPLNPEKGINIKKYYYEFTDDTILLDLENEIRDQIRDYTPYTVLNVACKAVKHESGKYFLHTFLSLREFSDIINVSTNGESSDLATIKM